jgi:hypothetical protein
MLSGSPVYENKPNVCSGNGVSIRNYVAGNENFVVDMSSIKRQKDEIYRSPSQTCHNVCTKAEEICSEYGK